MKTKLRALTLVVGLLFSIAPSSKVGTASAQVSLAIVKPAGVPNALLTLKGSKRRLFLNITGGTLNTATWTVSTTTGGATATITPSASGNWADIIIGGTAGTCPVTGTSGNYTITPTASVVVKATSGDDNTKFATQTFDICSPTIEAYTIPFYISAYSNERVDIQGVVYGAVDVTGSWSITSQPSGGDGALDDNTSNDAVFHASVAGRYKITWTPNAATGTTAYTTIYVTGNAIPSYLATPNGTKPVDCSVDPALTGSVYRVGPTQTYHDLEAVPWNSITAGTTIQLVNEDTTGTNPTQYPEWIQIVTNASHDQPVRLAGCADSLGNLPIMEGAHATARSDILSPTFVSGAAGVYVYAKNFDLYPNYTGPGFIIVEGIKFRDYDPTHSYCPAGSRTSLGVCSVAETTYGAGTSGFRFQKARDAVLRGVETANNGNGIFSENNDVSGAWGGVAMRQLFDGNNSHDNGVTGDTHEHNWYIQAYDKVIQFSQTPTYNVTAQGSLFKDRGSSIIRYNYFGVGAARDLDLVENQDDPNYGDPNQFLTSQKVSYPGDAMTGDYLAAIQERWHNSEVVYGNTFAQALTGSVHFAADNVGGVTGRNGELQFFNNTSTATAPTSGPTSAYRYSWFDTGDNGSNLPHVEWPNINIFNNILYGFTRTASPYFSWGSQTDVFYNFGKNLLPTTWGTGVKTCTDNSLGACDGTGWPFQSNTDAPTGSKIFTNNVTGDSNFVTTSSQPFNTATYVPTSFVSGNPLPVFLAGYPVRFQYLPANHYATYRSTAVTATTGGTIGALDNGPAPTVTSIAITPSPLNLVNGSTYSLVCTATYSDASTSGCTLVATWSVTGGHSMISSIGAVTGTSVGNGDTATATYSGKTTTATVNITSAPAIPCTLCGSLSGNIRF